MTTIERFAMHVGLTTILLQRGVPFSMLQQHIIVLNNAAKELLNDESIDGRQVVQVSQLVPDGVVDELIKLEGTETPDDLSSLDGEPE